MGMTEKKSLINAITVQFVEEFGLNLKNVKNKVAEILQNYHVTISDECFIGENVTTEYLIKKFSDGKSAMGMAEKTIKQYVIAVQLLEKYCEKKFVDIEPEDLIKFFNLYSQKVSSVTVKAKYQLLSSVYNYLFNHKYIGYNPIVYVDSPKAIVKYKEPMTDFDLEKIKKVCEKMPEKESLRDMAIVHFLLSTGCRVSEIAILKIGDIDFQNRVCKVLGKGKKERPVVISDSAFYRLKLYLESRMKVDVEAPLFASVRGVEKFISKDGIERIIKKITERAKIKNVTCHSFRRFYATELRKRNVSIQMIASSLGHANLNQINRYSLYNSNEMLDQIRKSV